MSLFTSEAIIIRTYNLGEQDKIVAFFTKDKGIMKGVAKGARKLGNRFGSSLEPLSLVKIIYYEKETKELVIMQSCELLESFFQIQTDLKVAYHFSYFAELTEEFFPWKANEELSYRLLLSVLRAVKEGSDLSLTARYFEMWLLKIYGILPDFTYCHQCKKKFPSRAWLSPKRDGILCDTCATLKKELIEPTLHSFVQWAKKNPPGEGKQNNFTINQLNNIARIFREIIITHLERIPKTLSYLNEK